MNIELVKIKIDEEEYKYKYKKLNYCCDKLRKADNVIYVSEEYPSCGYEYAEDDTGSRIPQMMICDVEYFTEFGEEFENCEFYPIKFCPFCGKPIEVGVIGVEDCTIFYNKISAELKSLYKKIRVTDSKKEECVLRDRTKELNDLINYFFEVSEYKEVRQPVWLE